MAKMIIMKGLPASGKSTIAQGRLLADGNTVRINKDLLRKMLHFNKFTGPNEALTREASRALARAFLTERVNVIIDDTNLNEGTMQSWKDLAKDIGDFVKVEVMDLTDVPIETCVERDMGRDDSVGKIVIHNMAIRAGLKKFQPDEVVICDIDGTIADTTHRQHFVDVKEDEKKDWKGFFGAMGEDTVREDTKKTLMGHAAAGRTIIFMSARPEKYKDVTERWLNRNFLTFAYTVIMRSDMDKRPDTEVKRDMFEKYFPDKSVVHAVYDDRPSVIRLWKELGLNVIDVGKGIEF